MERASKAKQLEEKPEIAAALHYLRTRRGLTNHEIQDALNTYGSALVEMHQQALHTDGIARAQEHRLHTEQMAKVQHNHLQAQAATERATVELKWKEWWQPAQSPKL